MSDCILTEDGGTLPLTPDGGLPGFLMQDGCIPAVVGGGHAKSLRYARQGPARDLPAWLAISARKRKRQEDEELRAWLAAKRKWLRLTDDEYLLDMTALPPRMS